MFLVLLENKCPWCGFLCSAFLLSFIVCEPWAASPALPCTLNPLNWEQRWVKAWKSLGVSGYWEAILDMVGELEEIRLASDLDSDVNKFWCELVLWQGLEGVWDISVYVQRMAVCGKVMDILDHGPAGKKATIRQMSPFWSGFNSLLSLKQGSSV